MVGSKMKKGGYQLCFFLEQSRIGFRMENRDGGCGVLETA